MSNHSLICEKQIILLMIPNEENSTWHYLAVKTKSAFLHKRNIESPFQRRKTN